MESRVLTDIMSIGSKREGSKTERREKIPSIVANSMSIGEYGRKPEEGACDKVSALDPPRQR
jgi:hypothetical protein